MPKIIVLIFRSLFILGNIIPAIATTNAIIAGLMVMEGLKILSNKIDECQTVYLNKQVKTKNRLLVPCKLEKPNPKCYVCAKKPEVKVYLDIDKVTVRQLEENIFKEKFGMLAPDVEIDDGKGSILISSEEDTNDNWDKVLSHFISNGSRLKGDDFLQDYELVVTVCQKEDIQLPDIFLMEGDLPTIVPNEEKEEADAVVQENGASRKRKLSSEEESDERKKIKHSQVDSDDEIMIL